MQQTKLLPLFISYCVQAVVLDVGNNLIIRAVLHTSVSHAVIEGCSLLSDIILCK